MGNNIYSDNWETSFDSLTQQLIEQLDSSESLIVELQAENSHFIRFNHAKVRQTGIVIDGEVNLKLITNQRNAYAKFPLTGDVTKDLQAGLENLNYLRQDIQQLPEDPHIVLPQNQGSSHEIYRGNLLNPDTAVEEIVPVVQGLDFTGIYTSGRVIRANYNSLGQKHWFATDSFFMDYSLINEQNKAIKSTFAGNHWEQAQYLPQIDQNKQQLQQLNLPIHEVKPGKYRTYLAPAAVANLLSMFSWGGISEASLRQSGSALGRLREGETLSPLFNLKENFQQGNVPRFNDFGEMSPLELPLIVEGKLVNTLISSRTAVEYGLQSNGASSKESLRSAEISTGELKQEEILSALGTGLYVSNLHYLNWSDLTQGRITGMTRYGCFWVEKGEIVATIKDLRFDEQLYSFFGQNLLALTDFQMMIPEINTYGSRGLGGSLVPGILVEDFTFTL